MSERRPATDAAVAIARSVLAGNRLPPDSVLAFGPQGLASVHVCLIEAESMSCESSWTITEEGVVRDAGHDAGFARAMATIVHLNPPGRRETVTRQLAPQRWALGWHVDERRVIVAEARYRAVHDAPGDVEVALLRMLCDARIRPVGHPSALGQEAPGLPEAANDQRLPRHAAPATADLPAPALVSAPAPASAALPVPVLATATMPAVTAAPATQPVHAPAQAAGAVAVPALQIDAPAPGRTSSPSPARHPRLWVLPVSVGLVLTLAGGGLWFTQWRHTEALAAEARRLQAVSETTLVQSTAAALDRGDYGELQFELDRFQALRYFDTAVVLNSRGQVVSKSGAVHGVRIGETMRPEFIGGSRSFELRNPAGQPLGRLLVWPAQFASRSF